MLFPSCEDSCGRLLPRLNVSDPQLDDTQEDEVMRIFAHGLRAQWKMGSCGNDVIIVFYQEFGKVSF